MRFQIAIIVLTILATCLGKRLRADIVCWAPNKPPGCTNCALPANAKNPLCLTTTTVTTTTKAVVTTSTTPGSTTPKPSTTTPSSTTTTKSYIRPGKRRLLFLLAKLDYLIRNKEQQMNAHYEQLHNSNGKF